MSAVQQLTKEYASRLATLPKLGVGLSFQAPLQDFV